MNAQDQNAPDVAELETLRRRNADLQRRLDAILATRDGDLADQLAAARAVNAQAEKVARENVYLRSRLGPFSEMPAEEQEAAVAIGVVAASFGYPDVDLTEEQREQALEAGREARKAFRRTGRRCWDLETLRERLAEAVARLEEV